MEASIEGLIDSAAQQDVLFVLWHLSGGTLLINEQHPSTKLTALETIASIQSRQANLIIQILLLSGASPTIAGAYGSAIQIARSNSNAGGLEIMENWEKGAKSDDSVAQELLSKSLEEAEEWLRVEFPEYEEEKLQESEQKALVEVEDFLSALVQPKEEEMDELRPKYNDSKPSTSTLPFTLTPPQIVVQGIALSIMRIDLETRFREFGAVELQLRRNFGAETAFALVYYDQAANAAKCLSICNGLLLGGETLRIEPFEGSGFSITDGDYWEGKRSTTIPQAIGKLFIANIAHTASLEDLELLFAAEANPAKFQITIFNSRTRRIHGSEYTAKCESTAEIAGRLITRFNNYNFQGMVLIVEHYVEQTSSQNSVFIGHLTQNVVPLTIIKLFEPIVDLTDEDIRLRPSKTGHIQYALVTLKSKAMVKLAINELDGAMVFGKAITVSAGKPLRNFNDTSSSKEASNSFTNSTFTDGVHPSRTSLFSSTGAMDFLPSTSNDTAPSRNNWNRVSDNFNSAQPLRRSTDTRRSASPRRISDDSTLERYSSNNREDSDRNRPAKRLRRSSTSPRRENFAPYRSISDDSLAIPTGTPPPSDKFIASGSDDKEDDSRLAALNLDREEIEAVKKLWQPSLYPSAQDFNRTLDLKVTYGWVSPEIAKKALLLPTPFPGDPKNAALFVSFLKSQTEHYSGFFNQLSEFNENVSSFVKNAKSSIVKMKQKEISMVEEKEYNVNGNSQGVKLEMKASSRRDSKVRIYDRNWTAFEFVPRVKSHFGIRNDRMLVD